MGGSGQQAAPVDSVAPRNGKSRRKLRRQNGLSSKISSSEIKSVLWSKVEAKPSTLTKGNTPTPFSVVTWKFKLASKFLLRVWWYLLHKPETLPNINIRPPPTLSQFGLIAGVRRGPQTAKVRHEGGREVAQQTLLSQHLHLG